MLIINQIISKQQQQHCHHRHHHDYRQQQQQQIKAIGLLFKLYCNIKIYVKPCIALRKV